MTKKEILKMTGLTESDFYKKYPTQESFMMEYGGKIAGYEAGGKVSYSAKDAAAGKDIGKPGKNFSKIAAEAGERYGSKEAGERVAGAILAKLRGKHEKGGSITPTPTGDIFDMMGMSYLNKFADGGDINVKAPLYDETELDPNINTNLYRDGSGIHIKPENRGKFTAWASAHNMSVPQAASHVMANTEDYSPGVVKMANFAKNAAGWKHAYGGYYASGGYTPMYGLGNWIADAGKFALNTVAAPLEQVTGNNFVNFNYDNKAMADAAAITEGTIGAATDIVGTSFGGPIYGMAKGQLQGMTKNIGKSTEGQRGADDWANKTGQIVGSTGDFISGIASGNPAQIVGGAGNLLGTTGQQFGSQELGTAGQLAGMTSQFVGSGKAEAPQNAMGLYKKNGGNIPGYMQNMRKFAQGGMTVGNVESKELLIDPNQYGAGGVPKVLADYTNLPAHPKDGSIDDRGTVPLPENKFIVTKPMAKIYKIAEQSNDGLLSAAVTNKVAFNKNKKEQEEMQKASNAYGKFMAKYGGTIEKMYGCGGKTYGCGGMVKYDLGSMTLPTMGSSLPQGWGLNSQFNSGISNALPSGWNVNLNEPSLPDVQMGSSLPQGWNLQPSTGVDGWQLNSSSLNPFARTEMTPMNPIGPSEINNPVQMSPAANPYANKEMASKRDLSDYDQNFYNFKPSTLGQIAPMIPSVAMGLEAALSKPYNINANDYMVSERLTPQKTVPNYRPIRESEMRTAYDLSQMAPGSGGYLAARTALGGNAMRTKQDYLKSLQDEYNKQKLGADQFNITKDMQNKQTALAIEQFNEQNRAARRNAMREQFGKNLPAAFYNQQYNNMGMQAIQAQYRNQPFNWGIFGKSQPNLG